MIYIYSMPIIHKRLGQPKESEIYSTYWQFASERQNVFFNKIAGCEPLTEDNILKEYKFTNAYRAADRASQYLIREVIYSDNYSDIDTFFRIILFKLFNKIETWTFLEKRLGPLVWENYTFQGMSEVLNELLALKRPIYSGAYIMASGKSYFGYERKFQNHLKLIELMINEDVPGKIRDAKSLGQVYSILRAYPTLGNFLAFQFAIDLNYSEIIDFSEMDFVVAGPGAKDGITKCFKTKGDFTDEDIIRWVTDHQEEEFDKRNIKFKTLWGRQLHLIDCQNLFCEVDKYSRVSHPHFNESSRRTRIKQKYKPKTERMDFLMFPPKWGLNRKIL